MAKKNPWDDLPDVEMVAAPEPKKNPWDDLPDAYEPPKERSEMEKIGRKIVNELPMIGSVAGGILGTPLDAVTGPAGTMAGAALGATLGSATKNLINRYIDPEQAPKTDVQAIVQPLQEGAIGAASEGVGNFAAPYIAKGVKAVAKPASEYFRKMAEKKAVAATGATGVQATKFDADAGRQLLDRKIVQFADNQENIARKAGEALNTSGKGISDALKELDSISQGVPPSEIVATVRARAAELGKSPATYGLSDDLMKMADDIELRATQNEALTAAEKTKRDFQGGVNYNSSSRENSFAEEMADIYKNAVERAAIKADPKVAAKFQADKKTYGLLSPIAIAAEKRASTVNQSPPLGLMDSAWGVAGNAIAGNPGVVALPVARKIVAPRINSSIAVAADRYANKILEYPKIAEMFTKPISQMTGEMLWKKTGINKLGIQPGDIDPAVLASKEGSKLLIEASDLPENSKKLETIKMKLMSKGDK